MKRSYQMIGLTLLLVIALMGIPASAQMDMMAFCGDLAEADCTLLQEAQTAAEALTSGTADMDMSFSVSGIPDMPFESLNINLTGSIAYAVDPLLVESMMSLKEDPSALFASPEAMSEWLVSLVNGVSGDLNLTLNLPAELTGMMSSEDMTVPETISIDLRMVDGFGYVNLSDVAAAVPDADIPPGWVGVDLGSLVQMGMAQSDMSSFDPEVFQAYMSGFQDPSVYAEFMTVARVEDTTLADGQAAAVFDFTFDYGAFFQSEMFQNMMQMQMEAIADMSGEEMDADAQAEMEEAMNMMGPMMEDINLTIREVIGLDDKYVHSTEVHLDWDMADFMAMVEPDAEGPAPVFTFDFVVNQTGFNNAPEITAPEDATILPLESMIPQAPEK